MSTVSASQSATASQRRNTLKTYNQLNNTQNYHSGSGTITSFDNRFYRLTNEDRHTVAHYKHYWCYALFDGHGGEQVATCLASKFPSLLFKAIDDNQGQITSEILKNLFSSIDGLIEAAGFQYHGDSGCTALICVMDTRKQLLHVINLGDSRAIISDVDSGQLLFTTRDHVLTNMDERARIDPRSIIFGRIGGVLAVPRAFGNVSIKQAHPNAISVEPELYTFNVRSNQLTHPNMMLVLACDGVWDVLSSMQVASHLHQTKNNNRRLSDIIVEKAVTAYSTDNITVMCIKL